MQGQKQVPLGRICLSEPQQAFPLKSSSLVIYTLGNFAFMLHSNYHKKFQLDRAQPHCIWQLSNWRWWEAVIYSLVIWIGWCLYRLKARAAFWEQCCLENLTWHPLGFIRIIEAEVLVVVTGWWQWCCFSPSWFWVGGRKQLGPWMRVQKQYQLRADQLNHRYQTGLKTKACLPFPGLPGYGGHGGGGWP
jgi:hypothetical protein